jgi:hypothetical protein
MNKSIIIIYLFCFFNSYSQTLLNDFLVNPAAQNVNGVGRTAISADKDGSFAVAWQDFNSYGSPERAPSVAVQMFNAEGLKKGPLNFFRAESRPLSSWLSDYIDENFDIAFTPEGNLLLILQHEGYFVIGTDDIWSSETGIGAVNPNGEIIDLSGDPGYIRWYVTTVTKDQENPRLCILPDGSFVAVMNGRTYSTNLNGIVVQPFTSSANTDGEPFTTHVTDLEPQFNHMFPDAATNGSLSFVVWQDGRQDNNFDISGQFYSSTGSIGTNIKINQADSPGNINILPSVSMNSAGSSIVVWADARNNPRGEIFGQLFNQSGQPAGPNFQISMNSGGIMDRPEASILKDGSFMVVWTDSLTTESGSNAYRAFGRRYNSSGSPVTDPFIIPEMNIPSGLVNISTDEINYFLSWLDNRAGGENFNVYAKVIGNQVTSADESISVSTEYTLAQNYPNPFNPSTTISYSLAEAGPVRIIVYNQIGEQIALLTDEYKNPGKYNIIFQTEDLSSGVYYYRIVTGKFSSTRKMILMR